MKRRTFLKTLCGLGSITLLPAALSAQQYRFHFPDLSSDTQEDESNDQEEESSQEESDQLKILIPLYSYPNWQEDDYVWQSLIDLKGEYPDIEIIAVVNPTNGHFNEEDSNYTQGITDLVDAEIKVVGYVYTQYGDRDTQEIIQDLDAWQDIYQSAGVSGIFFDETSTDIELLDYYSNLSSEARERNFEYIVLNAGITTDQSYIDSGIANLIVTYETTDAQRQENPPSSYNEPSESTDLSLLIYEMEEDNVQELIDFAQEHQFGYIYFTEDGFDGNPWDSVSSYLEEEISQALQ